MTPLAVWYAANKKDVAEFEKQMRRKVHYVIKPDHLWASIAHLARTQNDELLKTLQKGFKYIENESFQSTFQGLFSEINLGSDKLGKTYDDRNAKLCTIIRRSPRGWRNSRPTPTRWATPTNTSSASSRPARGRRPASSTRHSRFQASSRLSSRSTARSRRPARRSGWKACSTSPAAPVRCS